MNREDREYALEPTAFHRMREAQELTGTLEDNLRNRGMGAANVRAMVVEIFSELVNRGRLGPVNNLRCREAIVVQQRVRNKRESNGRGYQRHALTTQWEPASECWRPWWPLRPGSGGGLLLEQREHAPGQAG